MVGGWILYVHIVGYYPPLCKGRISHFWGLALCLGNWPWWCLPRLWSSGRCHGRLFISPSWSFPFLVASHWRLLDRLLGISRCFGHTSWWGGRKGSIQPIHMFQLHWTIPWWHTIDCLLISSPIGNCRWIRVIVLRVEWSHALDWLFGGVQRQNWVL